MSVSLFLGIDNSQGSVQKPIWQRRRTSFVVSVAAIALLIVLAFEGISLFWPHPAGAILLASSAALLPVTKRLLSTPKSILQTAWIKTKQ
jgi:ABC-type phosphate transport system auxiliary subunit